MIFSHTFLLLSLVPALLTAGGSSPAISAQTPAAGSGLSAASRDHGLALTPPMGFNTWNTFKMNPTETVIKEVAAAMAAKGFQAAGYQYVNIDEGWDKGRGPDGQMIVDPEKFPNGLKVVADYIHSKGLRAGIYTDLGPDKPGYLGSEGHYDQDMKTFASWDFDYVKVDVNHVRDRSEENLRRLFSEMSAAVKNCGRPMVFSICNQGDGNYADWAPAIGSSWRVGKDIDYISWVEPYQKTQWEGVLYELDRSMAHAEIAGPGAWNDADMMLVGVHNDKLVPLTSEEAKSHFSLWCVISSPLIIGADIRQLSPEDTAILTNEEAISISQDPYGRQARLVFNADGLQVYSKVLQAAGSGERGIVLFNRSSAPSKITINAAMIGLRGKFAVRDLWTHADLGRFTTYTADVTPHGAAMLKITSKIDSSGRRAAL